MKKLLAILGTVILGTSTIAASTSTITISKVNENNTIEKAEVDWTYIKNNTKDYFDELKKQDDFIYISNFDTDIDKEEVIQFAENKTNQYLNDFIENDLSYEEIIDFLKINAPGFIENYQESKVDEELSNLSLKVNENFGTDLIKIGNYNYYDDYVNGGYSHSIDYYY
jgi:hypothetical protein